MQKTPIKKISTKQQRKNAALYKIKADLEKACVICCTPANELAHLLPKSVYPEYYTKKENLVILCHKHHDLYDNNKEFRVKQVKLRKQVESFDKMAADKYFEI